MSDRKKIDERELENVSGGTSDLQEAPDDGNSFQRVPIDPTPPPGGGGPGADAPEGEGGGGGNQDLQI